MKDILKSFLLGVGFASGFFLAIHFTADAELDATAEQAIWLDGVVYGAREATVNRPDQWRCMFAAK
jgi:hypothetical protein